VGGRRGKGEGSIYQRADGKWAGQIDLGWINGKRKRKYIYATTRAEVQRRVRELSPQIEEGLSPAPERLTLAEYLETWLNTRIPGTISVRTETMYSHAVHQYINPLLGKIRLNKLAPSDVAMMIREMERQGYSPSTQRMARATLRRALRIAQQDGILSRNVASIAEGPKLNQREGRSLTPEEAKVFLKAVQGKRLEVAYTMTLALGLRRGEILGLTWDDIIISEDTVVVTVRHQLIRDRDGVHLDDLKTVGSRRTLHLSRPLVEALDRHRIRQDAEELVQGPKWRNDHNLVFTSTIGTPLDPDKFGQTVPKICKEAGLGHWSIHELRHSCASLMIAMEVPLEAVAEQLGHASIRVTKDVYGHLMPKSRAKAAEAMRSVLFEKDVPTSSPVFEPLAVSMAVPEDPEITLDLLTRDLVGRPGLDPGTLGLKGQCGPSFFIH